MAAAAGTMQATRPFFQQCCVHSGAAASSSSGSSAREGRLFVSRAFYSRQERSCSSSSCGFVAPSSTRPRSSRLRCSHQLPGPGPTPIGARGSRVVACAVAEPALEEPAQDSAGETPEPGSGRRDWNAANVLQVDDIAPGVRNVVLEVEVSREYVELENAYTSPGQLAVVEVPTAGGAGGNGSVGGGEEEDEGMTTVQVACASAPFSMEVNRAVLLKLRGDISAGESKVVQYMMSVKAPLHLYVEESKAKALYDVSVGTNVWVGPFQKTGMDFLPIMFLARYPTMLLFADDGPGIAAARAVVEAKDVGSLMLNMREEVRLYYAAAQPGTMAYRHLFPEWESRGVKVRPTVREVGGGWHGFVGSFSQLFDEDDLEYDPESTAAVVCGSRKTIDEVTKLLEEAGIPATRVIQWESR